MMIIFLLCIYVTTQFMNIAFNGYNQIYRKIITIQEYQLSQETCIAFGMWSKYNPLNIQSITQRVGQFESNCFQLINMVDYATQSLNFIYYDCLNYSSKQIVKTIMFKTKQDQSFQFNNYIGPFEYENIWYNFQLISWPLLKKLELFIIQQEIIIFKEIIEDVQLFNEQQLLFTLGGSFQVMESKLDLIEQGTIFSLFPGQIVSYDPLIDVIPSSFNFEQFIIEEYQNLSECICLNNEQVKIEDSDLNFLDDKIYISDNINCNYYRLSGWMRVQDIIQKSDVFLYQFMKMTANIGNQQILNENLSTFQLFYQISPLETKIVIKTYSYNFPIVTNDILDSSFEIEREFVIQRNNLKSWHYLQLELQDNKFNIKISFYDNEKVIQFYETQVDVKQFHNCQFKLRYGNILQNSQNYLNVEIKQLYYINCRQDDIIKKCHYSCLDCNGPNISNCLSCSVESNRIYIPQFNHCICPQSSIDYQQRCMNNEDLDLQIIEKQNIYLKCQIGYFELEGECKRWYILNNNPSPSRISDNLITCYDCFANQEWSLDSFCYTDYYTPISFELSSTFIFTPIIFLNYDGSDFVFCEFCEQVFDQKYDLQNQINLYELFLFKSQRFLQFCFTLDKNDDEGKHCYLCTVINCILCQIAIDQQLCVICREGFKQINGLCIYNNNQITYQSCQPPYYTSFMKQCTLCTIQYCLYCFQYLNDSLVSTFDGLDFALEEIIKIGCVQCQDGYTFDFTLELCLQQVPKIQNCLTSYVMQFKEVCIVSSLENFQVSPIINKCDNFIINCYKCALDNNKIIFCIECIDGFMLQNGQCYMNQKFGSNYEISNWDQKIKAFLLIYRKTNIPDDNNQNIELSFQCGRSCLKCNISDKQYICDQCNIDCFDDQIRIQHGLYCPECPRLCQVCETRSFADIKSFNPLFSITKENSIITQKCILPKFDPFIFYDPYLKTTQYCLDGDCNNGLEFEYWQYDCFLERLPRNLSDFGINTEYCNQVGLKTLTFSLYFEIDSDFCHYNLPLITKATLKVEVFTLKTVNLRLKSVNQFPFIVSNSLEFYEYDTISMINTEFIFLEYLQNYILFSNQQNQIDVILVNFTIKDSSIVDITSLFYAEQFGSIYIQNFSIINTTIRNSSLFNLQLLKFEGQMTISSLFIVNCTFIDAQLFQFSKSLKNIQIVNLTLDTCTLQNASLYTLFLNYIKESTIQLKNLIIQRNNFQNSNFFFCSQLIKIDLIDVILNSNHFENSIIFGFSYSLSTSNIQITDNIFIESSFLQTIQVTNDLYTRCSISKLLIYKNVLQNTNLFNIFSNSYSNNLQIDITRVHIVLNIRSITTIQLSQIFNINSQNLEINDFIIQNNQELLVFNLYDNEDIKLTNLFFENQIVQQKVSLSKNCFQKSNIQNQLLLIRGFDKIEIENCNIINQSSIDESLIEIVSSKSKQLLGQIFIKNVEFYGNLLQQLNQVQQFSLLTIISDKQIEVVIEDLKYQNNFMHVYSESSLKQSAALLYISSAPSNIFVNNLDCIQNSMTNSSNSFIMIRSKILKLSNILIKNHNILPYNIWKDYYTIKIQNENDQEEINLFIMQIYHIKSIGGVAFIETSSLSCLNCTFQEIFASTSSVFDIVTLNEGIITISNFSVNSTKQSLEQTEGSGCITLNSQNSLLNLSISNAQFTNVINRMSTSIISIQPSLLKNKIVIQDVQILNCISLKNQIIHIQFINQIIEFNSISLINIKIIQNQQDWETYFQMIGLLTLSEILEITKNENSLIYLENCDIYIRDFIMEGMLITPVFNLINVQHLSIFNLIIESINSVNTQNLIQISQTIQTKSITYLKQFNIRRGNLFKTNPYPIIQSSKFQSDYFIIGCSIMNNSYLIEQPEDYFFNNINQLQQSNYQQSAIIHIMSKTNLSTILLEMIHIENNIYQTSLNGIIYFDIALFQQLRISKLDCNYNFINEYGCLHFIGNNSVQSKIQIKDSNFINNNGTKGVAIKVTDISLDLKNCKIASNFARSQGGGLYLQITSNLFRIQKTQILNNKAQEGGGIYFDRDHNLNSQNFYKSFLLFNKAKIYGNNLVESPTHLTLFINSKQMTDEKQVKDNTSTSILKIQPYKTIEQGKLVQTKQLILPSNQEINVFQLLITKGFFYQSYIKNMSLFFLNSKGELLYKQLNSTCNVSSAIIKNDSEEVRGLRKNHTVLYESGHNNFELGTLAFNLDPYEQDYDYLKIQVQCKTQYSQKLFTYIMNAKSFKCQLGEFYVDNGCQICIWSQGFYSVTYNSIKCSIFDKIKFQNITSNMINLYEGYWRPNYLSDYTESCYKNPEYCLGGWEVGDSTCKLGRKGALCEMCDIYNERGDGSFFKNQQDLTCLSCSLNDSIILPFLFALFQALLSITLSLKSLRRSNQLFTSLRIFEKFSKIIFKLNQDHEGILVKMLLNYLWIFSVIFTFNISFSFSFIFIEQSSNSFYFMVNNLDCYLSNLQTELIYIKIVFILILMLLQFNLILALSFIYHSITKTKMDNSLLSNTLLCLYVFNYGGLIKMLCSSLSSRQIFNINYIQGDVSLLYDTKNHYQWIYYIIIPLLLLFGCIIPFSLFLLTYLKRDILNKIKLRKHICYLFNEYTDTNYYWEQFKLLQKAMIILITTYFENNILLQTSLLGLCLLTYQTLTVKNKPYIISKFNNLDLQSGQICSITIFLAATKYESKNLNNDFFSSFLQIVLLILLVKLCYPFIYNIFTVYYKKYSFFILSKIHSLMKNLKINSQFIQRFGDYLVKVNERQIRLKMNFRKLREYLLPNKNQHKMQRYFYKKTHLKSKTNSRSYFIEVTNIDN